LAALAFLFLNGLHFRSGVLKPLQISHAYTIVLVFKPVFLGIVQENIGEPLFFVLDSPRGEELSEKKADLLIDELKKTTLNFKFFLLAFLKITHLIKNNP
jgi:hypothetical protein